MRTFRSESGITGGKICVAPLMLIVAKAQWAQLLDDLSDG